MTFRGRKAAGSFDLLTTFGPAACVRTTSTTLALIETRVTAADRRVEVGAACKRALVEVAECRPISKTKSWILTRVIEKAIGSV